MPMHNYSMKRIQLECKAYGWNLFYYFTESFGIPARLAACGAKCDKIALIKL